MPSATSKIDAQRYKRPESVLVVVYTRGGLVLLLRRRKPTHFWQSVAGSLEWGESVSEAVTRELREETGLDAAAVDCGILNRFVIYPVWRHRYAPGVVENAERVFKLELDAACEIVLDEKEHAEYRWLPRDKALALVTSHTNFAAIERWVPRC